MPNTGNNDNFSNINGVEETGATTWGEPSSPLQDGDRTWVPSYTFAGVDVALPSPQPPIIDGGAGRLTIAQARAILGEEAVPELYNLAYHSDTGTRPNVVSEPVSELKSSGYEDNYAYGKFNAFIQCCTVLCDKMGFDFKHNPSHQSDTRMIYAITYTIKDRDSGTIIFKKEYPLEYVTNGINLCAVDSVEDVFYKIVDFIGSPIPVAGKGGKNMFYTDGDR